MASLLLFLGLGAAALAGVEVWSDRYAWPVDPAWYRLDEADGLVTFGCQNYAPVQFAAIPAAGVRRILVLGGSAAFGFPDRPVGEAPLGSTVHGLAGAMQATLDARWPAAFEVVNLGVNGGTSEDTLRLARRGMDWGPAALVVYDGNNEFMDVPREMSPSLWRFSLYRRTAVLREKATASPGWVGAPAWGTDAARGAVYARFRHDLEAVAELAEAEHVPLLFVTQAANLRDFDPSWSVRGPEGGLVDLDGATPGEIEAAYAAHPGSADLAWLAGRVRLLLGGDAEGPLQAAVDLDGMPFRPTTAINTIVREVAADRGVTLVDGDAAVRRLRPTPGEDELYDWVHPRPVAAAAIGGAIVDGLAAAGVVERGGGAPIGPTELEGAEATARDVRVAVSWVQWACVRHHDPGFRLNHADQWARAALTREPGHPLVGALVELVGLLRDPGNGSTPSFSAEIEAKLVSIHPCVADRLKH